MDMNQYLDMFIEEAKEHLQAINNNMLAFEQDMQNINLVNEIFRSAHTLKGMAATMGFEDLASLTHEMENVLDGIRHHKISINVHGIDVLFQSVDALEEMVNSIINAGDGKKDVAHIVQQLTAIAKGEVLTKESPADKEAKETASTVQGYQPTLQLDDFELTVLQQSTESGYKPMHIKVTIRPDCVLKSARAYMVFDLLEKHGEVIKAKPTVEELEEEKFDLDFELVYVTKEDQAFIKSVVEKVSEIDLAEVNSFHPAAGSTAMEEVAVAAAVLEKPEASPVSAASSVEAVNQAGDDQSKNGQEQEQTQRNVNRTIRVSIERLDVLMNLFSELVIDRGRLDQIAREIGKSDLLETVEHMNRISGDLQNLILTMRMVPIEQVFNRFPRMVRGLARDLGKKINLNIVGAETELDRTVIDEIGDPLVHLLRNALDHGLETTAERISAGKDEHGNITLKAFHSGNQVFIDIQDDGRGINREKVLQKAISNGIISLERSKELTDHEVHQLLFASGFSTADVVSDISGRGVGLDVVKNKIESLGGAVSVHSELGKGTTFSIQLPLTMSIIASMLVQVCDEKYAIPLTSIIETAVYRKSQIMSAHRQKVIDFRGKVVPLVDLKQVLDIEHEVNDDEQVISLVIVRKGDKMAALVVDSFIGQQEVVLKSLGNYLVNVFAISGATILGDGQVALILDCNALIK